MSIKYIFSLIVYILLSLLFISIIYVIVLNKYNKKIMNRFDNYTITNTKNTKPSLFDTLFIKINNIIKNISKFLSKSIVITNYSKRYEKYAENTTYKGIDLITIKLLLSIILSFLYIISTTIRFNFQIAILILILFSSFFLFDILFILEYNSRRKNIEKELLNAIIIMNNAFKSGMNIIEALNIVCNELSGNIKSEFLKIKMDIDYGLSLETVFDRFYERVKIEDIKYISSSLSLINKTGGNIVKVFDSIEKNFYDKKKINDELKSLTSSSRFMFNLLVLIPIILVIIIVMLNNEFFLPLINTTIGRVISIVIIILYMLYILVIKSILKVKYYE